MIPPEISPKPEFHSLKPAVMLATRLVVAGTVYAARAGVAALAQGGSAADAAVAAGAVQAVVMPYMNGLDGGRRGNGAQFQQSRSWQPLLVSCSCFASSSIGIM
jgi:hypothetical protein